MPATSNPAPRNSDSLNFTELIKVVKLRRRFLYAFTLLTILGAAFKQVVYVPTYVSETKLSIQKVESSPMQIALANLGQTPLDTSDRLKRYIDYLSSQEFFLAVAEQLKFQEGYHLLNLTQPWELGFTKKKFWVQFLAT